MLVTSLGVMGIPWTPPIYDQKITVKISGGTMPNGTVVFVTATLQSGDSITLTDDYHNSMVCSGNSYSKVLKTFMRDFLGKWVMVI